jgi:uncharacterized C2H2 Zn-finger protein
MKDRCYNEKCCAYNYYGGRGITICDQWKNDFNCFINDMDKRPKKCFSLERIDNNLGYFPENCKWATRTEQARNTRRNRLGTVNGITKCYSEWAEVLQVDKNYFHHYAKDHGFEKAYNYYTSKKTCKKISKLE